MQGISSLKDFRIKYSSLASLGKVKSEEEFLVAENVLKLELKTCQEALLQEKKRIKELMDENSVYVSQNKQLESHTKTLTNIIAEKDTLISKLWNDIISIKKSKVVNEGEILSKIDTENEISAEGTIGELPNSIGKSMISSLIPSFVKKSKVEIDEIKKLRNELEDSQLNNRILNERMKELTEIYSKLEIETQELKETLKFYKENSVVLTQQILKISGDKEAELVKACTDNDELMKKLELSEIDKKKVESLMKGELEQMRELLFNEKLINKNLKEDLHMFKEENIELKGEMREFTKILKNKEAENRELALTLQENQVRILKTPGFQQELLKEIKDSALIKCCCNQISAPNTQVLIEKLKAKLKTKKLKIEKLKKTVESLKIEMKKQPKEPEIFYSSYVSNSFLNESHRKSEDAFVNPGPVYYNIEKLKLDLENQKIAKRKARAEKEQAKEDLAHAILEISEVNSELLEYKLKADDSDFLAFLLAEAKFAESLLNKT